VEGARNVFDFALECKRRGPIETVNHISTTYVAGTVKGLFFEKDLDLGQGFNNTYEQSKYEAELLVDDYRRKGINITVFRPSILTGGAIDGRTSNFKMLYQPLHFFSAELFDTAPINRDSQENLIPVDSTAMSIVALAGDTRLRNKTYHIANTSTIGIGHFIDVAADFFGFKAPEMIPVEEFNMGSLSTVQESLISPYVPYFNYTTKFGVEQSQKALRQKEISIPPVGDKFLEKL
jgi:nucleoside-diphosphate-sugar epimerase